MNKTTQFLELIIVKSIMDLKVEVSQYYLNYLWWVIEPIITMAVFYVVFEMVMKAGTPHFGIFLLCGLVWWDWFARTVTNATTSIVSGQRISESIIIHKAFFPLTVFLKDLTKHTFVVFLFLVLMIFYPLPVTVKWLAIPIIMAIQSLYVLGFALLVAGIIPFLPDLRFVISTVLLLLFFSSGIFMDLRIYDGLNYDLLIYLNPLAGLINSYRSVLIDGSWPNWMYLGHITAGGLIVLTVGFLFISKFDKVYPRIIVQR